MLDACVVSRERLKPGLDGLAQTLGKMRQEIEAGGRSLVILRQAQDMARYASPLRDRSVIDAIFAGVIGIDEPGYGYDPRNIELIRTAEGLKRDWLRGDCDDLVVRAGSLLESVGIEVRVKVWGPGKVDGRKTRFVHTYLEAYDRQKRQWVAFDPVMRRTRLGRGAWTGARPPGGVEGTMDLDIAGLVDVGDGTVGDVDGFWSDVATVVTAPARSLVRQAVRQAVGVAKAVTAPARAMVQQAQSAAARVHTGIARQAEAMASAARRRDAVERGAPKPVGIVAVAKPGGIFGRQAVQAYFAKRAAAPQPRPAPAVRPAAIAVSRAVPVVFRAPQPRPAPALRPAAVARPAAPSPLRVLAVKSAAPRPAAKIVGATSIVARAGSARAKVLASLSKTEPAQDQWAKLVLLLAQGDLDLAFRLARLAWAMRQGATSAARADAAVAGLVDLDDPQLAGLWDSIKSIANKVGSAFDPSGGKNSIFGGVVKSVANAAGALIGVPAGDLLAASLKTDPKPAAPAAPAQVLMVALAPPPAAVQTFAPPPPAPAPGMSTAVKVGIGVGAAGAVAAIVYAVTRGKKAA